MAPRAARKAIARRDARRVMPLFERRHFARFTLMPPIFFMIDACYYRSIDFHFSCRRQFYFVSLHFDFDFLYLISSFVFNMMLRHDGARGARRC